MREFEKHRLDIFLYCRGLMPIGAAFGNLVWNTAEVNRLIESDARATRTYDESVELELALLRSRFGCAVISPSQKFAK